MPAFSEDLQEKMESGKIHLGGCCINGVRLEDGSMIRLDAERYCNHCRKEFAKLAYWQNKGTVFYYPDMVEAITFEVGGFFQGRTIVSIKKNPKSALVHVDQFSYKVGGPVENRQITPIRWMRLVNKLYNELFLHEWKKDYDGAVKKCL